MRVIDIANIASDSLNIEVHVDGERVAEYNGKDSIPEEYNEYGVESMGLIWGNTLWMNTTPNGTPCPAPTVKDILDLLDEDTYEEINPSEDTLETYAESITDDPREISDIMKGIVDSDVWLENEVLYIWVHSGSLALDI